jgi:16S rRNA (cytosine967-C5)-methyltransferase
VLVEEDEDVLAGFLARHPELRLRPAGELLGGDLGRLATRGGCLRLSPHRHGTDGFFGAVLERRKAP